MWCEPPQHFGHFRGGGGGGAYGGLMPGSESGCPPRCTLHIGNNRQRVQKSHEVSGFHYNCWPFFTPYFLLCLPHQIALITGPSPFSPCQVLPMRGLLMTGCEHASVHQAEKMARQWPDKDHGRLSVGRRIYAPRSLLAHRQIYCGGAAMCGYWRRANHTYLQHWFSEL